MERLKVEDLEKYAIYYNLEGLDQEKLMDDLDDKGICTSPCGEDKTNLSIIGVTVGHIEHDKEKLEVLIDRLNYKNAIEFLDSYKPKPRSSS